MKNVLEQETWMSIASMSRPLCHQSNDHFYAANSPLKTLQTGNPQKPGLPWFTWESSHFEGFPWLGIFQGVPFSGKGFMAAPQRLPQRWNRHVRGATTARSPLSPVLLSEFMHAAESVQVALPEPETAPRRGVSASAKHCRTAALCLMVVNHG